MKPRVPLASCSFILKAACFVSLALHPLSAENVTETRDTKKEKKQKHLKLNYASVILYCPSIHSFCAT